MSERQQDVWVYANKWLLLDPSGKPICTVPRDTKEGGSGKVGAKLDPETKEWIPLDVPVKCKATRVHRMSCVRGELFPATASDAAILNLPFVDPKVKLAEAKAAAITVYDAQFGEGAWVAKNEPAVAESDKSKDVKPAKAGKNS